MEELSRMAMAYFNASSVHLQEKARDFFRAMDHDGDDKIDQREFFEFMKEEGYLQMTNPSFFNQLDLDNNGTLEFEEVMTVYYILITGRPFCNNCNNFIASTYLTCVGCLEDPTGGSFYLCLDCYSKRKCNHSHDGRCRFLDNYSLLEAIKSKLKEPRSLEATSRPIETKSNPHRPPISNNHTLNPSVDMFQVPNMPHMVQVSHWPPMVQGPYWPPVVQDPYRIPMVQAPYGPPPNYNYHLCSQGAPTAPPVHNHTWIQTNYTYHYPPVQYVGAHNAIVPQRQKWKEALEALNVALQLAVSGTALCSIM